MGRAKLRMERIDNKKQRKLTFKKRKDGLMKKAQELSTLCDIKVSMIICNTDDDDDDKKPLQIFPTDDQDLINSMIDVYKQQQRKDPGKIQHYSVSDFFNERKIKIEKELAKEKKKNLEAKYPTWFELLNNSSEVELREFAFGLEKKIQIVKTKMEKKNIQMMNLDHHATTFYPSSINPNYPILPMMTMIPNNLVFSLPADNHHHNNFITQSANPNSEVEMMLMRENGYNYDNYDQNNFSLLESQSAEMMIPMNYTDPVYFHPNSQKVVDDQIQNSNVMMMMQSESPNLETSNDQEECYDYESFFNFESESPTFWPPPEMTELPPLMHMNSVSASESSSFLNDYY